MLQFQWILAGAIVGMLIATVIAPPTRMEKELPNPHDGNQRFHTDVGCVRFRSTEVPCSDEPDSLNLLATK
jgi:hypothetical protein